MTTKTSPAAIPVVDLGPWPAGSASAADRTRIAAELTDACRRVGFAYVVNHGIPTDILREAFSWTQRLFDLPTEKKMLAPHPPGPKVHRGYSWPGLEKVSQNVYAEGEEDRQLEDRMISDLKESYEIGNENFDRQPNVWLPEDVLPGFREFTTGFYWKCFDDVAKVLLRALALGLGEDEEFFLRSHSGLNNQLRLLHYPSVDTRRLSNNEVSRMPAHADWSTITILFQDEIGGSGLQVEDPHQPGCFIDATPMKDALIMNVGDMLMRWSNDHLKSTLHRVTVPSVAGTAPTKMLPPRYSIPYFVSPDPTVLVECLPACTDAERPPRYPPITQEEYDAMRQRGQYL